MSRGVESPASWESAGPFPGETGELRERWKCSEKDRKDKESLQKMLNEFVVERGELGT